MPRVGDRVMVRYRLPAGSVPPLTDAIGHLLSTGPTLKVRTRRGDVVSIAAEDVVVMKTLAAAPVRTADIRNLEHAAALAWPGVEQQWIDGWLARFARGATHRGNSAVPLGVDADATALPAIVAWYAARGATPWLSVPDRLFRLPDVPVHLQTVVMARDLEVAEQAAGVSLLSTPDEGWRRLYARDVPVDVLTSVVDGEVVFASVTDAAVGRAAVTHSPDGTRWVGLSAVRVTEARRRRGHARSLCAALLTWGRAHGATRAYVQVLVDNAAGTGLFESMGFVAAHRSGYVDARSL